MSSITSDCTQQDINNVSLILPPPPPPPLLKLPISTNEIKPSIRKKFSISKDLCTWAANESDEFREACQKWLVYLYEEPIWHHTHLESLLQEGPTCGLVAMSMLLHKIISPLKILDIAKASGYSKQGEMFSVKNMYNLLHKITEDLGCKKFKFELCKGSLTTDRVIDELINGAMMLVPYDCDKNHYPCLRNGHGAHWAIINGILTKKATKKSQEQYDIDNTYVTAKHGKTLHLAVWKLKDLENSNRNLYEIASDRADGSYVFPEGGLACDDGLNEQFILIHKMD